MKTVLIAVHSTTEPPYAAIAKTQLETWDTANVPGVDTMFYFPRDWRGKHPHTMAVDMDAGFFTQGRRALLAYAWLLKNRSWDYMARVNASCYVRKQLLLDEVQKLPESRLFRGVSVEGKFLWGGGHYIITRDVVEAIVRNGHQWDHAKMEDVAMSELVKRIGIPWDATGRACSINHKLDGKWMVLCYGCPGFDCDQTWDVAKAENQYFIRCKQDTKPDLTMKIMRELHAHGI